MEKVKTKRLGSFNIWRKGIYFVLSFLVALLLTYLIKAPGFTDSQNYVLFLLFFAIGLWLTEAIPPFAVALFIMAYLIVTLGDQRFNSEPQSVAKYVQTFSNSIIWLILSGFFLAEAMTKTGIDTDFFRFSLRLSGHEPKKILLGIMITTMVASFVLSNTAATTMVIAAVMPLLRSQGKSRFARALLSGIPLAAAMGGMGTIIATPPNAIAVGELENIGIKIDFLTWMKIGMPLAILLTFSCWFFLSKLYIKESFPVSIELPAQKEHQGKREKIRRLIVLVVLIVTVLLWLTTSLHHFSIFAVSIVPIVSLTMTGILKAEDIRALPWDSLLLVAGGLSLGLALQETQLLEHFTRNFKETTLGPVLLYFVFAYLTTIFGNFMSNTATATILIPLGISLMPDHAKYIALIVGFASSTGLLLPVSTPPNAVAYSTGLMDQRDFLKGGLLVGILAPPLIVLLVLLLL
ncbi:MAG: transporter [Bacteroidetes bacterium]|nr:MAG: transporter [Bacteroidota bacterium]